MSQTNKDLDKTLPGQTSCGTNIKQDKPKWNKHKVSQTSNGTNIEWEK